jgi:hypothetical protein
MNGYQEKRFDKMTNEERVKASAGVVNIRAHQDENRAKVADPTPEVPEWKTRPYEEPTEVKIVKKGVLLMAAGLLAIPTGGGSLVALSAVTSISAGAAITATGLSLGVAKDVQPVSPQDEKNAELATNIAANFSNPGGALASTVGALATQTPEGVVQYGNVGTKAFNAALLVHSVVQPMKATQAADDLPLAASKTGASKVAPTSGVAPAVPIPPGLLQNSSTTASRWMTQADIDALAVRFVEHLPEAIRAQFVRNETVAIALVQDAAGKQYFYYAVAGNRTSPAIRAAAEELGLIRVTATPRAAGRGDVGAPSDAEQILIEAFNLNPGKIMGVPAATRPYCADCAIAVQHH